MSDTPESRAPDGSAPSREAAVGEPIQEGAEVESPGRPTPPRPDLDRRQERIPTKRRPAGPPESEEETGANVERAGRLTPDVPPTNPE